MIFIDTIDRKNPHNRFKLMRSGVWLMHRVNVEDESVIKESLKYDVTGSSPIARKRGLIVLSLSYRGTLASLKSCRRRRSKRSRTSFVCGGTSRSSRFDLCAREDKLFPSQPTVTRSALIAPKLRRESLPSPPPSLA